ncbi:hypothetical protein Tsp_09596 [Trichinella spiralis]|uniref:hypothetical protein n=1 Tax=Trichinella spiralis TaxID=6334 RepID=UPI0001EFEE4A|nr:hypothetical protein Tsp_09596 [Trichinella spiralis]
MIGNTVHQLLICTFCCPLLTLVHVQCATKLEADWLQLNLSSLTIVSVELFSVLSSSSSTASPCPNIGAIPLREGVVGELLESQLPLWTWSLASVLTNIYVGPRKVRKIIFGIFFLMIVFVVSYALMWMIIYNHIRLSIPTLSEDYHQASSYSSSSLSISDSNEEILHGDGADDVQHVPNLLQKAKNNTCSTATINFSQSHSSPSLMYSY